MKFETDKKVDLAEERKKWGIESYEKTIAFNIGCLLGIFGRTKEKNIYRG